MNLNKFPLKTSVSQSANIDKEISLHKILVAENSNNIQHQKKIFNLILDHSDILTIQWHL